MDLGSGNGPCLGQGNEQRMNESAGTLTAYLGTPSLSGDWRPDTVSVEGLASMKGGQWVAARVACRAPRARISGPCAWYEP